jgi:hypothetical protein
VDDFWDLLDKVRRGCMHTTGVSHSVSQQGILYFGIRSGYRSHVICLTLRSGTKKKKRWRTDNG